MDQECEFGKLDRVPDIDNEFDIKFANSMIREKIRNACPKPI